MGRRVSIGTFLLVLGFAPPLFALPFSVTYSKLTAAGVRLNVIVVDLDDPNVAVVPAMAKGFNEAEGKWTHEPFSKFIHRLQPTAAINGTFFSKTDWKPAGSVLIDGKLVSNGDIGTAFCLDPTNKPTFIPSAKQQGSRIAWGASRHGLTCGPTLVWGGKVDVRPEAEGFHDSHVLGGGVRSALGVTASRQLLLVTTSGGATLTQLAQAMKALGAHDAINLDGGASQALYFRGNLINTPGRELTNVLLIYENKWRVPWTQVKQAPAVKTPFAALPAGGGPDAHVAKGKQFAQQGKWREAADEFLLAAKMQPDSAAVQRALGDAYEKLGLLEEAARVYRQAAEIYQQKGFADAAQALLLRAQGLLAKLQPPTPPQPSAPADEPKPVPSQEKKPVVEEKKDGTKTDKAPPSQPSLLTRARLRVQPYLEHTNWTGIVTGVILFVGMDIGFALGGARAGICVLGLLASILVGIAASPHVASAAQGRVKGELEMLHCISFLTTTGATLVVLLLMARLLRKKEPPPHRSRRYGKRTYPWVGALFGLGGMWLLMGTALWYLSSRSEADSRIRTDIENSRIASYVRDTTARIGGKVGSVLNLQPPPILFAPNIEELPALGWLKTAMTSPSDKEAAKTTFDEKGEEEMLKLVNAAREKNGLAPLTLNEKLRKAAREHSDEMVKLKYFSHDSPKGVTPFDRIKATGLTYVTAGENIAQSPTVAKAHEGLMKSKGHRENILRSAFTEVGIGVVDAGKMGKMVTQNFIGK
jgi:uncharacterized protein YkwD